MKKAIFWLGGICGVAAGIVIATSRQREPTNILAHQLEAAWADHHTIV